MKTTSWMFFVIAVALAALIVEGRIATSREIAVLRVNVNEKLEAARASTNESIAALRRDFASLRADFTSLRADVTSLRGEVSKLGERVVNIEGRLDGWSLAVLAAQGSRTVPDAKGPPQGVPKPR